MPKIRHWFNVSHDINSDEEVWELTDTYGVWGLRVWLQMLSIADRNEGVIKGDLELNARSMSRLWGSNSRRYSTGWRVDKARMMIQWMANKGWIVIGSDSIRIRNYATYRIVREAKKKTDAAPPLPSPPLPTTPTTTREEEEGSKIKSKRPRKRGQPTIPYPDGFKICDLTWTLAEEKGWENLEQELQAFKDHHVSKGNAFADWDAAFRTWLRNSKKWGSNNGKVGQVSSAGDAQPKSWAAIERFRRSHGVKD